MNSLKVKAYIGFAIKSRAIVYGVDNLKNKKVQLIICSASLSAGSKERCEKIAKEKAVKLLCITDEEMLEIIGKSGVKVLGITDKALAQALIINF